MLELGGQLGVAKCVGGAGWWIISSFFFFLMINSCTNVVFLCCQQISVIIVNMLQIMDYGCGWSSAVIRCFSLFLRRDDTPFVLAWVLSRAVVVRDLQIIIILESDVWIPKLVLFMMVLVGSVCPWSWETGSCRPRWRNRFIFNIYAPPFPLLTFVLTSPCVFVLLQNKQVGTGRWG